METVDEGLVFVGYADPAAKVAFFITAKCGCDVTSVARVLQVAKFTKYSDAFSVISVV